MKNTFEKLSDSKFMMSEHDMKQIKGGDETFHWERENSDCGCVDVKKMGDTCIAV